MSERAPREPLHGFGILSVTKGKATLDYFPVKTAAHERALQLSDAGATVLVTAGEMFFPPSHTPPSTVFRVWQKDYAGGWQLVATTRTRKEAEAYCQSHSELQSALERRFTEGDGRP